MRILLTSNMYPSEQDPAYGVFVKAFVDNVSTCDSEAEMDLCVIRGRSKGVMNKLYKYIVFYTTIIYKILFTDYDVVYTHHITSSAPSLLFCSLFKNYKLILNIHGGDFLTRSFSQKMLFYLAIPLLRKADQIVVPSLFFKDIVMEKRPELNPDKIFVSPSSGIKLSTFHPTQEKKHDNRFVYVSRIDAGKGWEVVLKALSLLKEQKKLSFTVDFVGPGAQINRLNSTIKELGLELHCRYMGSKSREELVSIYNSSKFMLFPTMLYESLGLVGIEALACKCPVIGSNRGCIPEYLIHGKNGFLFSPGDFEELALLLKNASSIAEDKYKTMCNEAYNTALRYDSVIVAHDMVKMIKNCINR